MITENQPIELKDFSTEDLSKGFSFAPPEEAKKAEEKEEFVFQPPTEIKEEEKGAVIIEKVEEKEKPLEFKAENSFYTDLIKKKISKGIWQDAEINEGDKKVKISEIENATEEDYYQFEEDQKAIQAEDIKEKYLAIDKVSPEKKLILEIVANGGDLKEIFKNESQLKKPFDEADGWDLDNEKHLENIVYQHYLSLGNTPNKAAILVDVDKKEMALDAIAKEVVEFHQKAFTDNLEKVNKQLVEDNKVEAENLKKHYQELIKTYKELGVPDTDAKKYATSSIKEVNGQYEVDEKFEEIMRDPKQAAELIFFMFERDKYKKAQGIQTKIATQESVLRQINRIPKTISETIKEKEEQTGFSFG